MTGRSAVYARGGLVATSQPLATLAGIEVLADGGNAADAAAATMGALYATMPMMCGVGGDAFVLYYDAQDRGVTAFCGSGAAPALATPAAYAALGHTRCIPAIGMRAAAVPGAVDATWELWRRFGSGRLHMPRLWRRAVAYAQGHPLAPKVAKHYADAPPGYHPEGRGEVGSSPQPADRAAAAGEGGMTRATGGEAARRGSDLWLGPSSPSSAEGVSGPQAGEISRQPELAATLEAIAQGGPDWFYRGPFAQALEVHSLERGGFMRASDLAAHRTWVGAPLEVSVGGLRFFAPPPPSQGLILLEELGILAGDEGLDPMSAEGIHLLVEAKKRAFADRLAFAGDPNFTPMPLQGLLSPGYLRERRAGIDGGAASEAEVAAGDPWRYAGSATGRGEGAGAPWPAPVGEGGQDTTCFVVVDGAGNAAAVIISLFAAWGCREVVAGTGVVLNNRGHGFSLRPDHPNRLVPGKRTMHTLHNYLAVDERGALVLLGGTPGGDSQPQWNLQVVMHLLRGGCEPQEAVERPRWSSSPGTTPPESESGVPYTLTMEDGFAVGVTDRLAALGHVLQRTSRWGSGGSAQLIVRAGADGVFAAGSDPRADGCAMGL